jgi:predicted GNAT superfamily acetyltransferase
MNLAKLFNHYADERGLGPKILYIEDVGFATYHLNGEECYIEDIYVVPERRKSGEAADLANTICEMAKDAGAKILTGSVNLKANGKEASMKVLLAYGMSPVATNGDMVYFSKEL